MRQARYIITAFILFLFSAPFLFSQDSVSSPYHWQATAKKTGEGRYEIIFTTSGAKGWQLYAPNQLLSDVKVAELILPDSSISQEGSFSESGTQKTISSIIFENTSVKVYEDAAEWKVIIQIHGDVP